MKTNKQTILNAGENADQMRFPYIAGGNAKVYTRNSFRNLL